jgi:hypothetical protein
MIGWSLLHLPGIDLPPPSGSPRLSLRRPVSLHQRTQPPPLAARRHSAQPRVSMESSLCSPA